MTIGFFEGKEIEDMNHEDLLKFAAWAAKKIEFLEKEYEIYKLALELSKRK